MHKEAKKREKNQIKGAVLVLLVQPVFSIVFLKRAFPRVCVTKTAFFRFFAHGNPRVWPSAALIVARIYDTDGGSAAMRLIVSYSRTAY